MELFELLDLILGGVDLLGVVFDLISGLIDLALGDNSQRRR